MIALGRNARLLEEAQRQPVLAFTAVDVPAVLEEVRREHFPQLAPTPIVFVAPRPRAPLACIVNATTPERRIFVHAILNDAGCPEHVFRLIAKHELVHAVVSSRKVDGRWMDHPPEFWDVERRIATEAETAWEWIADHLHWCIYPDKKREGIFVEPRWRQLAQKAGPALRSQDVRQWVSGPSSSPGSSVVSPSAVGTMTTLSTERSASPDQR